MSPGGLTKCALVLSEAMQSHLKLKIEVHQIQEGLSSQPLGIAWVELPHSHPRSLQTLRKNIASLGWLEPGIHEWLSSADWWYLPCAMKWPHLGALCRYKRGVEGVVNPEEPHKMGCGFNLSSPINTDWRRKEENHYKIVPLTRKSLRDQGDPVWTYYFHPAPTRSSVNAVSVPC